MKVRNGFVTNSSSSSYIVVSQIDKTPELMEFIKEELGRYGVEVAERVICKPVHNERYGEYEIFGNAIWDTEVDLDTEKTYICAEYVEWTTEGDKDNEAAWLRDHLTEEFYTDVYGESGY